MAPNYNSIPTEIIILIFSMILNQERGNEFSPTTFMLICKNWAEVGASLLLKNVKLDDESLLKFVIRADKSYFDRIQNLTITPDSLRIRRMRYSTSQQNGRAWYEHGLLWLGPKLPFMTNLTTFSFSYPSSMLSIDQSQWLRPEQVHSILRNLPPSVKHLEFDMRSFMMDDTHKWCICAHLVRILPQLVSLKLGITRFCPYFLAPSNNLESVVINGVSYYGRIKQVCNLHVDFPSWTSINLQALRLLSSNIRRTALPRLRRFQIVDNYPQAYLEFYQCLRTISIHDPLSSTSTTYPVVGWIHRSTSDKHDVLIRCRDGGITDIVNLMGEIDNVVGYLTKSVWVEETRGGRWPISMANSRLGKLLRWKGNGIEHPLHHVDYRIRQIEGEAIIGRITMRPTRGELGIPTLSIGEAVSQDEEDQLRALNAEINGPLGRKYMFTT